MSDWSIKFTYHSATLTHVSVHFTVKSFTARTWWQPSGRGMDKLKKSKERKWEMQLCGQLETCTSVHMDSCRLGELMKFVDPHGHEDYGNHELTFEPLSLININNFTCRPMHKVCYTGKKILHKSSHYPAFPIISWRPLLQGPNMYWPGWNQPTHLHSSEQSLMLETGLLSMWVGINRNRDDKKRYEMLMLQ